MDLASPDDGIRRVWRVRSNSKTILFPDNQNTTLLTAGADGITTELYN